MHWPICCEAQFCHWSDWIDQYLIDRQRTTTNKGYQVKLNKFITLRTLSAELQIQTHRQRQENRCHLEATNAKQSRRLFQQPNGVDPVMTNQTKSSGLRTRWSTT